MKNANGGVRRNVYVLWNFVVEQVFSEESDEGGGVDETAPPKPSRGPDVEFPLQRKDIDLLIEAFRKKKVRIRCIDFSLF